MQEMRVWFLGWKGPLEEEMLGKFHGQRSLVGYSPWARRVGHDSKHTRNTTRTTQDVSALAPLCWPQAAGGRGPPTPPWVRGGLYILFHWSGTPVCSQLVFGMHFSVWRCIPDVLCREMYSMPTYSSAILFFPWIKQFFSWRIEKVFVWRFGSSKFFQGELMEKVPFLLIDHGLHYTEEPCWHGQAARLAAPSAPTISSLQPLQVLGLSVYFTWWGQIQKWSGRWNHVKSFSL